MSSVQFRVSVESDSFWRHGQQHARLPCSSPTSGACSNSYALSQWCHPTISSLATPLSSCPQFLPAWGSFLKSLFSLFASGGQSIGGSASAPVLPMNIQGWFPLGLTDLLAVWETLKSLLQHHISKASILWHSAFFMIQLSHLYTTTGKTVSLTIWTFAGKVMSLLLTVFGLHQVFLSLQASLFPQFIIPFGPPLFPHWLPTVNNFSYCFITDSTLLLFDFPVTPDSWCPNKN